MIKKFTGVFTTNFVLLEDQKANIKGKYPIVEVGGGVLPEKPNNFRFSLI